ncbi:HIT domain-containing protein [Breznakiella homolactica]|uniref:HIT domain-containing protein n=1 Tax=Breznakiella homolactica TaxID=2798577 RepID=A0A7T7XKQ1_9SPIR|nr:HIT domain-containing protein [Breznakiella homolactica]QQO08146.1 HIT domain-containing protein [Breznakiella homolactica]
MEYFFNFDKFAYLKGKRPEGCILCLIRENSPDVTNMVVYRNSHIGISLNLYPYNPGHLLIFPLRHTEDIRQLGTEERLALDAGLDKALSVLDGLYTPAAYNIGYNMGPVAGASINHLHMHVIPRYPREIGIAELLAGKRVLVEDLAVTRERMTAAFTALSDE